MLGGIKNTASTLSNMNKMKQQQDKLQKLLASVSVSGVSKNGKVIVTMTGDQKIVDIKIDPTIIEFVYKNFVSEGKEDTLLSKSIMEALEDAMPKIQGEVMKKMQETGGIQDFMSMLQSMGS